MDDQTLAQLAEQAHEHIARRPNQTLQALIEETSTQMARFARLSMPHDLAL